MEREAGEFGDGHIEELIRFLCETEDDEVPADAKGRIIAQIYSERWLGTRFHFCLQAAAHTQRRRYDPHPLVARGIDLPCLLTVDVHTSCR